MQLSQQIGLRTEINMVEGLRARQLDQSFPKFAWGALF